MPLPLSCVSVDAFIRNPDNHCVNRGQCEGSSPRCGGRFLDYARNDERGNQNLVDSGLHGGCSPRTYTGALAPSLVWPDSTPQHADKPTCARA